MNDTSKQIFQLKEKIASLENLRDVLGDEVVDQKITEIKAQLHQIETAGGAVIQGDVDTKGGAFVGRDQTLAVLGNNSFIIGGNAQGIILVQGDGNTVTLPADEFSTDTLINAYYRALSVECSRLPLGIVDPRFAQPGRAGEVSLSNVYTDLDVVSPPRKEEESAMAWGIRMARGEGDERTPLLEAIAEPDTPYLVLLGDPGSGKTTFINYLTYRLARSLLSQHDSELPTSLQDRPVVRLVLSKAGKCIPAEAVSGNAQMLWDAVSSDITTFLGEAAAQILTQHLQKQILDRGGIFLLDGLDEVPEAARRRKCLLEAVQSLTAALASGSRVVLTARPYAYADPSWYLQDFKILALAPFNQQQVHGFVDRWYQAVRPAMGWDESIATERGHGLKQALEERDYLSDLASRPLLLTLMTTLHSSWGQLPDDRADLYEETVKLLLSRWERGRFRKAERETSLEPGISTTLGVSEEQIRFALEQLAFEIHIKQRNDAVQRDAPADISLGEVLAVFAPLTPPDINPQVIVQYIENRSGLLLGRREGVYAFPHRSFQEYLAACHLASDPDFGVQLKELVWEDPEWWREVCLLGIGKASQGGLGSAVAVLNVLVPEGPEEITDIQENHWHLASLSGQAILELRLEQRSAGQPHLQAIQKRAIRWLAALVEGGHLKMRERLTAGDVLGQLGDSRPGVGLVVLEDGDMATPDITWVEIPPGNFTMGSSEEDTEAYADERPEHTPKLPPFRISRYPVTNAQYRPFVDGGGYDDPQFWTEEGWAWRQGAEPDFSSLDVLEDEDLKKSYREWILGRKIDKRNQPFWWGDPKWGASNRPVVGVCWYEVFAFCKWLGAKFRQAGSHILKDEYILRLPTEAEWEKAARGPGAYRWPWGNEWQEDCANTKEAELNQTTPVGMFPKGLSGYKVDDMAGNIWEWTKTRWGRKSVFEPDYNYPYDPKDGREEISGPDLRVLRGGSWGSNQWGARCACRGRFIPDYFNYSVGFRVVVSLADSGF
jgi:formylglycine-generating enzyme required for sulfatase activity